MPIHFVSGDLFANEHYGEALGHGFKTPRPAQRRAANASFQGRW
jgi:hypothetical protein